MKKLILILILLVSTSSVFAQRDRVPDVWGTNYKGWTTAEINAFTGVREGDIRYNSQTGKYMKYTGSLWVNIGIQDISLSGTGNKDLTIEDGSTIDLTGVDGIDPDNIIGNVSGRTNVGAITNFAEQSLADYNTDGAPSAGVKILIKDPLGMEEVTAGSSTIDWIDSDGYLIAKDLYLDNTTDDVTSFTLTDMKIGYTAEIYLNQATEPTFTPSVTIKADTLDWTADSLGNTDVTLTIWRNGLGAYEGVYTKGY